MEPQPTAINRTHLRRSQQLPARYRDEDTIIEALTILAAHKQTKDANPIMPPTKPSLIVTLSLPASRLSENQFAQLEELREPKEKGPAKENQDVIEYDSEAEIDDPHPQTIDSVKSTQPPPNGIFQGDVTWDEVSDGMKIKLVAFLSHHMSLATVYNELCLNESQVVRFIKMYNHEWCEYTKIVDKVEEAQRMKDRLLEQGAALEQWEDDYITDWSLESSWTSKTERVTPKEASTALDFIDNFGLLLVRFRIPEPPHNNELVDYIEQCVGFDYRFHTIEDGPIRPGDKPGTWVDPEPAQEPMNVPPRDSESRKRGTTNKKNDNTKSRGSVGRSSLREVMNAEDVGGGSNNAEANDAQLNSQLIDWVKRFEKLI